MSHYDDNHDQEDNPAADAFGMLIVIVIILGVFFGVGPCA